MILAFGIIVQFKQPFCGTLTHPTWSGETPPKHPISKPCFLYCPVSADKGIQKIYSNINSGDIWTPSYIKKQSHKSNLLHGHFFIAQTLVTTYNQNEASIQSNYSIPRSEGPAFVWRGATRR